MARQEWNGPLQSTNGFEVGSGTTNTSVIDSSANLILDGNTMPATLAFSAAAGTANICNVTITVKDAADVTITGVYNLDVWLSDAATGAGLTATSASGTVTAKTASGAVIGTYTAKKALRVQTLATGVFILEITDTAKTLFYPCASVPGTGKVVVGTVLATANYG